MDPTESLLDGAVIATYRWAVEHGQLNQSEIADIAAELGLSVAEAADSVSRLVDLQLLVLDPEARSYLPRAPEAASAALIGPIEADLREEETTLAHRRERVAQMRSNLSALTSTYFDATRQRARLAEVQPVPDMFAVRALITELADQCKTEI